MYFVTCGNAGENKDQETYVARQAGPVVLLLPK